MSPSRSTSPISRSLPPLLAATIMLMVSIAGWGQSTSPDSAQGSVPSPAAAPAGAGYYFSLGDGSGTFGPYEFFPDAVLAMRELADDWEKSFQRIQHHQTAPEGAEHYTPEIRLYPNVDLENTLSIKADPDYTRLERIDQEGTDLEFEAALKAKLAETSIDDPLYGYLCVNLAILDIKAGSNISAVRWVRRVSSGYAKATAVHQAMALRRDAWIRHQLGEKLDAYQAYTELQSLSKSDVVKTTCMVDRLGLLLELVEEKGMGTHADVRRAKEAWYPLIPETSYSKRAVMDLIEHETWARQPNPDYALAAELGEAILARYGALGEQRPDREYSTALVQTGFYYQLGGDSDKALDYFQKVLNEVRPDVETFAGMHPHATALYWMAQIADQQENEQLGNQLRRDLIEVFPDTYLAKRVDGYWPLVKTEVEPSEWARSQQPVKTRPSPNP